MINTQLYSLLKKLTPKIQEDFGNWLKWRLRGKELYLQILYEGLVSDPSWTSIWQKMFPNKPVPESSSQIPHILRKRAHALKKLLKEYLACRDIADDPYYQDRAFLDHIKGGKIDDDFFLYFRQMERAYLRRDGEYHEQMGIMLMSFYAQEVRRGKKKQGQRYQEMLNHFAVAYRFRFLTLYLSRVNNQGLTGDEKLPEDFTLKDLAQDPLLDQSDSLKLLLNICRLMDKKVETQENEHLAIIDDYKTHYSKFDDSMQQNLSVCLENYLNRAAANSRLQQDFSHHFNYYLWMADEGLSLINGSFPLGRYLAVVRAGINAGEIKKVRGFMTEFMDKLDQKFRADIYRYCDGMCLFAEGEYDELLKGFLRASFPSPVLEVNGRLLHLQARYENGERADLEVPLKSLLAFNKRHTSLNPGFKKQVKLKIQLFLKLLTYFKKEKVLKMQQDTEQIKDIAYHNWMQAKIKDRLEGKEFLPS